MVPPRVAHAPAATERGEETRLRLLEVAAASIARHGVIGTSLNDLVRQSGMTKGAFYFHFPSKEALALEVYRYKQEQWAARVMAAAMREERALDKLIAMVDALVDVHLHDPTVRAVERMCTELGGDPEMGKHFAPFLESWVEMTAGTIRQAQAEGDVRPDVDARAIAEVSVAAFIGMEEIAGVVSGGADLPRRVRQFLDLLLPAITTGK